jgi:hypothetical protein
MEVKEAEGEKNMLQQLKLMAFGTLVGLSIYAVAQAQTPTQGHIGNASQNHSGWVHIPGELINPNCVHEIPNGARVEVDEHGQMTGDVTLKGAPYAHYAACPDEPVVTRPQAGTPNLAAPGTTATNGWVEASAWNVSLPSTDNIDYLGDNWTVPYYPCIPASVSAGVKVEPSCVAVDAKGSATPATPTSDAIIYLFNAIEPSSENWILQPVLQYGNNGYFGGAYWVLASWMVGPHYSFYSSPVTVNPGDSLTGFIQMIGTNTYNGTLYWQVSGTDTTTGGSSWIEGSTPGLHWTWAFAGVLEVYNITSCEQLPYSGEAEFSNIVIDHDYTSFKPITPQEWSILPLTPGGPSCSYSVTAGNPTYLYWSGLVI